MKVCSPNSLSSTVQDTYEVGGKRVPTLLWPCPRLPNAVGWVEPRLLSSRGRLDQDK